MNASTTLSRRALLAAASLTLLLPQAFAQGQWPSKPIKLIVPFAAGGSNDNIARALAAKLGTRLGQQVVVENKSGGGGTIGTDAVAKAPADGYTLLLASTSVTTNAASGKKLPYDPLKDLEPIGVAGTSPFAIVVSNEMKVGTLRELIDLARTMPKTINYGSAGVGGINHLGTELFAAAAKVQLVHVPYKGISLAFTDLMGGSLQMLLPSLASVTQHIQSGKMRGLAVTGAQRSPLAPDIPTASEAGVPGFQLEVWFGLMGPARMPANVVRRLNEELNAVLASQDMKDMLAGEGATPRPGTSDDFAKLFASDITRWTRLIKESNIRIE